MTLAALLYTIVQDAPGNRSRPGDHLCRKGLGWGGGLGLVDFLVDDGGLPHRRHFHLCATPKLRQIFPNASAYLTQKAWSGDFEPGWGLGHKSGFFRSCCPGCHSRCLIWALVP